jgi:isopenicillin-N N-acyltransferase-like protein
MFLMKESPFRVLKLSGRGHDRGFSYGQDCRDLIQRLVASHYSFYDRYCDVQKAQLLREARKFVPHIEDYSPEIAEEMRGTAEGARILHEEVIMVTAFPEMYYPRILGTCTAFAVSDSVTANGDVYVGQNEDEALDPWLEGECSVLLSIKEASKPDIFLYTYAGIPATKGMNSEGIALCINARAKQQDGQAHSIETRRNRPHVTNVISERPCKLSKLHMQACRPRG